MKVRSQIWTVISTDRGHTWSPPRFSFANSTTPDQPNAFFNYQCSCTDAFVDGCILHTFVPHRWQQVLRLTLREAFSSPN